MLNYKDLYIGFFNILNNTGDYCEDLILISQKWTDVFKNFYLKMVAPIPGAENPNLVISLRLFQSGLLAAINSQTVNIQFEQLVQNLHLGICMGVNMTGTFLTTPPPTPLKLQHCFNSKFTSQVIANMLASTIFLWIQPTFSTQTQSGVIVKWM